MVNAYWWAGGPSIKSTHLKGIYCVRCGEEAIESVCQDCMKKIQNGLMMDPVTRPRYKKYLKEHAAKLRQLLDPWIRGM